MARSNTSPVIRSSLFVIKTLFVIKRVDKSKTRHLIALGQVSKQ